MLEFVNDICSQTNANNVIKLELFERKDLKFILNNESSGNFLNNSSE